MKAITALDKVLDKLQYAGARNGTTFKCHCPSHDDSKESLSVSVGEDGKVLFHCHAGCDTRKVVAALGLQMSDLFAAPPARKSQKLGSIVKIYDYHDADGKPIYQVVRYDPKDFRQRRPDGKGNWIWDLKGVRRVLYKLTDILHAAQDEWIFVVEGEKDADNLSDRGLTATTCAQGAGKWEPHFNEVLKGRRVCLVPDNDEPGRKHAHSVANSSLSRNSG